MYQRRIHGWARMNNTTYQDLDVEGRTLIATARRALQVDVEAIGVLRRQLIEDFGLAPACATLARFGFAQGWRMACAVRTSSPSHGEGDWSLLAARINALQVFFRVEPGDGRRGERVDVVQSGEADQHLAHIGVAARPVCWMTAGIVSGFLTRVRGVETHVFEDRCIARGDGCCRMAIAVADDEPRSRDLAGAAGEDAALRGHFRASLRMGAANLRAAEGAGLDRERQLAPASKAARAKTPGDIVARSPSMAKLVELTKRVAKVGSTVLITGESGTGKERIARLLHEASPRADGPFIAVNCGAITGTLLESELFGHCRGAFTGATDHREGLFEAANHGTLLLDEIGEVPPQMQVRLLRVLQEREVRRVGENRSRPIDVRVIAATNRRLESEVGRSFRSDLYYRIKVVELELPALRDRDDDLPDLATQLLERAAARGGRQLEGFTEAAMECLSAYAWPGNVRELENAMERAAALALGPKVGLEDLPEAVLQPGSPRAPVRRDAAPTDRRLLAEVVRAHVLRVLSANKGNRAATATQLGIGTATLQRKLTAYHATEAPRSK